MRVTLNLASRPYVELRPLYQRLRVIIAVLAVLAIAFWSIQRVQYAKAKAVQARVDAIQASVDQMQRERQLHEAEMKEPKNAAVLNQAQFLNNLFLKKAFSWTAVMIDLEHVLPAGVQVLNIDPVVAKDGHVSVRLRVLGQHDRAVDLVRNLEKSKRFLTPRLMAESADTSSTTNSGGNFQNAAAIGNHVNFDIVADYNPLPIKPAAKKTAKENAADATDTPPDTMTTVAPKHTGSRHHKAPRPAAGGAR
jgi:type IV pilus assembly protein PilN